MFVEFIQRRWVLVWSLGISTVLFIAVIPYPIHGLIGGSDLIHRIHDTVGSIQYIPLWAVPVFVYGLTRKSEYVHLAVLSSIAVFVTGVWSKSLLASASWMQLVTLLPLVRREKFACAHISPSMIPATIVGWWSSIIFSPNLISLQVNADNLNSHALRFHYSGMAGAYLAMAMCATCAALQKLGRLSIGLLAGSFICTGVLNLAYANYESALTGYWAIAFLATGGVALLGLRR